MIKVENNRGDVKYNSFKFSGGETQVKVTWTDKSDMYAEYMYITANITSSDDIMELLMVTDAIRRGGIEKVYLTCPYLPYARQDRVCAEGEALSLKVFCDLINSQNYDKVTVWDVHSDVALALLNNVYNVPQSTFVNRIKMRPNTYLVAPDAGSLKKIYDVSKQTGLPVIRADKTRDPKTGEITGTTVYSNFIPDANFLIVDDICDGGRTFIELAKKLNEITTRRIDLYVTHGIFSQGLEELDRWIDTIYCPNVWSNVDKHDVLKEI
jgi:ribose-phosphate pyrophosphokinase